MKWNPITDAEISPKTAHSIEASAERWRQLKKDYRFVTRAEPDGVRAE